MSLDRFLAATESIAASLATIAVSLGSGVAAAAVLGTQATDGEPAKRGPGRPKKDETTASPAPAPAAATAAPTPAPAAATGEVTWASVLEKITVLNKSKEAGHGRDGVLAVLKNFGLEGQKVPALEKLGKHAEVLAFVDNLLNPAAAGGEDDLGL